MADLPTTTGLVALGIALAESIKWLSRSLAQQKEPHQKVNGTSGQQPPSFWILEFGRLIDEKLENHEPKLREIIREELARK